jgi:hypothetical protein
MAWSTDGLIPGGKTAAYAFALKACKFYSDLTSSQTGREV